MLDMGNEVLIKQVANEETVLAVGFFIIVAAVARSIGAPYSSWANGHIDVSRLRGRNTKAAADIFSESRVSSTLPVPSTRKPSLSESTLSISSRRSSPSLSSYTPLPERPTL
jgi:hypothetical protein